MVEKCLLLKTQKNDVIETIVGCGLDPSEFRLEEVELQDDGAGIYGQSAGIVSKYVHIPTGHYCLFDMREHFHMTFTPGHNRPRFHASVETWEVIRRSIIVWLSLLKEQYEAPDLWAEYVGAKKLASAIDTSSEETFSASEQEVIKEGMKQIRNYLFEQIEGSENQAEKQEYILKQLEFLVDEAKHQKRNTWGFCYLGVLSSIVFKLTLENEQIKELFRITGSCLYSLFSGQPLLE